MRSLPRPTSRFCFLSALVLSSAYFGLGRSAPPASSAPAPVAPAKAPAVAPAPTPIVPPPSQIQLSCVPARRVISNSAMVPLGFVSRAVGAPFERTARGWKLAYFGHTIELFPGQRGALLDSIPVTLPVSPQVLAGTLYVPWAPIAHRLGIGWQVISESKQKSLFRLQFASAFIESARAQVHGDKTRIVLTLSNPTRIAFAQSGLENSFRLAAQRRANVPAVVPINDSLLPRALISSGNWAARLGFRTRYSAPVSWFTMGFPARLVIDVQRLFEQTLQNSLSGGLSLSKVRRGLADGPVQMFVVRVDPHDGWRMKLAASGSGGTGVLSRTRPSRLASRHKALVAMNGGFFAYDGAAVGAVMIDGEWIRLPWKGRTGLGFRSDGTARIANLQARSLAVFGDGARVPIRDLNGWPDWGRVTALTARFRSFYQLRPGEMALQIENGVVASRPGGGGVNIPRGGFILVASTGARPALERIERGTRCYLHIEAPGWDGFSTALGGGPRLLNNGRVDVTALRENFQQDVRLGRAPRTAFGIDRQGRYILLVVDGRQPLYSVGLTLTELAATMQKLGAVDALNLDGGGSTVMAIRSRVVNRPSDGSERAVSNALLVMRG